MSCVFGVWGRRFDVEQFLDRVKLHPPPYQIHRRGETSVIDKKRHYSSSVKFHASRAGIDRFRHQQLGAEKFLLRNKDELLKATRLQLGIEVMYLDFAVCYDDVGGVHTLEILPKLCLVAGELNVRLEVSVYSEPK